MRRVEDKAEFKKILLEAATCVFIDSRREPTPLRLLVFDDAMLCTDYFLSALRSLMEFSADPVAYFVVLNPDPVNNFYRLYNKYPVWEVARSDSAEAYMAALNEDVGDGQGFSLSILSSTWVVVPPSGDWFIHAMRSSDDDSGHLWVPQVWVSKLQGAHPGLFRDEPSCRT
jgi:hypothetical protein